MNKIVIYQLKDSAKAKYHFMDYDFALQHNFSLYDYKAVYSCERPDDISLDDIYTEFNIHRPKDFKGHSLSVSDIIQVNVNFYYCDSCGWSRLN